MALACWTPLAGDMVFDPVAEFGIARPLLPEGL
jgi:hypothetical protein